MQKILVTRPSSEPFPISLARKPVTAAARRTRYDDDGWAGKFQLAKQRVRIALIST
jgi:hypothetical protein